MPFHCIYHPPNLYTPSDKNAIAKAITKIYTQEPNEDHPFSPGLPPFLVVINFIQVGQDDFYVGGEPNQNFVRIIVQHHATHAPTYQRKRDFIEQYEKAIDPYTSGKGIDWELSISNEDPISWNTNGIHPPPHLSDAHFVWKKLNKPVEWDKESGASSEP
ncbi:hypothetical protein D9757_009874 [Collybiopsis confluens]|uniref:Tautomerase cis-CaaD-like domain-containing protein n=1 Tax=Collybiopsis confluens TaxID=2823264 RepID=A0A8H5GTU9_9AGAR|nr:hypothetical protein D9757_009874 [Collybiopsis confluens]